MKSINPLIQKSTNPLQILIRRGGLLFAILNLVILISCRERVTPPDNGSQYKPSITISAEDVGVTDAFIRLKFLDTVTTSPKTFLLTRDGKPLMTNTLITNDTLLLDEGLLPKRIYRYKAYRLTNNTIIDSSAELLVPTMDTTSHNFSWDITYLGDGASVLCDVAIINDTTVIAVGEINVKDSLGNWINPPHNMARWNGREWKLMRVMYNYQGVDYFAPLYSIFAFGINDYWVGSNQPMHWNGSKWRTFDLLSSVWNGWINKIWGSSSSNIYIVGNNGELAFYNGSSAGGGWRRLESGTTSNIQDVWGILSKTGNNEEVYCAVSSFFISGDQKILKITDKGNKIDSIPWGTGRNIFSAWTENGRIIYTAGSGIFENSVGYWREATLPSVYTNRIRGTSRANIFAVGDFGFVAHYNGTHWHVYNDVFNAQYFSLSVNDNIVVCVGQRDGKGIVFIGKKN